jgi:uroporphyrinogen-III synthase
VPSLDKIRVLVTRPRGQASVLARLLEAEGAVPALIPTIELAPPDSYDGLDTALQELGSYDWVLFTSANAVRVFVERARALDLGPDPRRVGVIGPATARAVQEALNRAPDLMPQNYVAESFAEALVPSVRGARVLLVRAVVARDMLPEALAAAGASLTIAEAYRTVVPQGSIAALRALFAEAPPDAIMFTSASTVQNLAGLLESAGLGIPAGTVLASIGPITSKAMRELDMEPTLEAAESTIPSLVGSLASYFARR